MNIIEIEEVIERTGLSRSTIWRQEEEGEFPSRRQISSGRIGWLEEEVDEWIKSRPKVNPDNGEK